MPLPDWLARLNRRFTNRVLVVLTPFPPFAKLRHRGRKSGRTYEIPLNAVRTDDGFLLALTYGPDRDWVKNVQAAGGAELEYRRRTYRLTDPEMVDEDEALALYPAPARWVLRRLGIRWFLRLRVA